MATKNQIAPTIWIMKIMPVPWAKFHKQICLENFWQEREGIRLGPCPKTCQEPEVLGFPTSWFLRNQGNITTKAVIRMSFGITALFYVLMLQTAAKRRWESEGIGVTRPLCGIQRNGNRKKRIAFLYEFPGAAPQCSPIRKCTYTIPAPRIREAGYLHIIPTAIAKR